MRFIDEAAIKITGGHGGRGCVGFRREAYAPRGGPDGGDGGDGGDVVFLATLQLGTLQDFRFKRVYQAQNGAPGMGANKAGRDGEDIEIRVPTGTIIRDLATREVLVDLTENNQRWTACKGGRGGKGNAHFATSTFQAPKFAQPGEEGEHREILLELKLIADVGIIGFPNVGKSTLISVISAARPKIADYPFTTLTPNLGVVAFPDHQSFVVADIPGLVEGAHRGAGLGHQFLRHIERTQLFIHVLDGGKILEDATLPGSQQSLEKLLIERYQTVRNELGLFDQLLLRKPEIVAISKLDVLESDSRLVDRIRDSLKKHIESVRGSKLIPGEPFAISAVSGEGIQDLLFATLEKLKACSLDAKLETDRPPLPDDESIREW